MGVKFAHMRMEPGAMDTHVCYMYVCASASHMCVLIMKWFRPDLISSDLNCNLYMVCLLMLNNFICQQIF